MTTTTQLAFLFTQPPFGTAAAREGLDALLAASAFCEEEALLIGFINDGVFNLLAQQQPAILGQKDHIAMFKLLDLYELPECYVCEQSLAERGIRIEQLILPNIIPVPRCVLLQKLRAAPKLLTF